MLKTQSAAEFSEGAPQARMSSGGTKRNENDEQERDQKGISKPIPRDHTDKSTSGGFVWCRLK
jgi:hypothetical protein